MKRLKIKSSVIPVPLTSDRRLSLVKKPTGDEIAVKPGREGLVYNGLYLPVTDLVLIATGLGVVPMIQMVKELLPYRDSSVSSASGEDHKFAL